MTEVRFYKPEQVRDEQLKFAVIAARYQDKWVLCRHKERGTWEIPGGHREFGENIEETARRELCEETGATDFEILPVRIYGVCKNGITTYGMLFWSKISSIAPLTSSSEIGEIGYFDLLPCELTYPDIQPVLFRYVQGWLNLQSNAGELWDVYNKDRERIGKLHRRGDLLDEGEYHLVVHIWLRNNKGEFLLTKRAPNKGFPHMWETTGGSALAGDSSSDAAIREVKEETGLTLDADRGTIIYQYSGTDYHEDVWLFEQDFSLDDVVLQEGETCDKMYASSDDIRALKENGQLVPYQYVDRLLEILEGKHG